MGQEVKLPNVNPEMLNDTENSQKKGGTNFNTKNYLNTRIEDGETSKTITIRLLPMDLKTGNPFVKVQYHNVKVPKEMVETGKKPYKSYICLSKNADIDHQVYGNDCPYCELSKSAYEKYQNETDPTKKEEWKKIANDNYPHESIIARCIERGNEKDGVKFWKFNLRLDKKDPYHAIINLYNQRKKEGIENILDIYNGYDLTITFTDGEPTPPPQIIDAKNASPLSTDEEEMKKWIYDSKKWQDVFTPKSYDFLSLVSEMRVPWFDKAQNKWVDKEEYDKTHKDADKAEEDKIAEADKKVRETPKQKTEEEKKVDAEMAQMFVNDDEANGDDLPF